MNILSFLFTCITISSTKQRPLAKFFFTFQGKYMGLWVHVVTQPFLPGSLTPGNVKLPPKHSSGLFVRETLVEPSCAQHRWKSVCHGREAWRWDPWNFGSFFEQQEKYFLQVYWTADQPVPKDAVPWEFGSICVRVTEPGAGRVAPRCSERGQQKNGIRAAASQSLLAAILANWVKCILRNEIIGRFKNVYEKSWHIVYLN